MKMTAMRTTIKNTAVKTKTNTTTTAKKKTW
jgi:hypothetical protein